MFVLATAGHVDHGKSTLLKALTGMQPDRLPEEKKRGLTINLNFLWADFDGAGPVGFIDVPGHHKFVGNMITGMSEVCGYLLVVAADDGWMPQTEEHLVILKAFNIKNGILVITKTDLSSAERIEALKKDSLDKIERALGKRPEAFRFEKELSRDVQLIREGISRLLKGLPKPLDRSAGRVWVDRAFVPKGLGVVATGTLSEGNLGKGQRLFLWPGDKATEARSLQSYGVNQEFIEPISRVAIQLSGTNRNEVARGSLLSAEQPALSQRIDAQIHYLKKPLKKNIQAKFYFGTLEEDCLIIPVSFGSSSIARILFKREIPVRFGDRFVIRSHGEEFVLAMGWIADPKGRSKTHQDLNHFLSDAEPTMNFFFEGELHFKGVLKISELLKWTAFERTAIQDNLRSRSLELLNKEDYVDKATLQKLRDQLVKLLEEREKMNRRDLVKNLSRDFPVALIEAVLTFGSPSMGWELQGEQIIHLQRSFQISGREKDLLEFMALPPHIWERDTLLRSGFGQDSIQKLVKIEALTSLKDGLLTTTTFFKEMEEKVHLFLTSKEKATTSELKTVLGGISRKYAIPLLEKLDENRITFLKDGVRQLLKKEKREG